MKLKDFFGIDIGKYPYETNRILDFLGLRRVIEKSSQVKSLAEAFGNSSPYVDVAKRQQLLINLKDLLSKKFLPYDKYYYTKDVNTSSDQDRQYNAEDRLLKIVLSIAAGERYNTLEENEFKPDVTILRGTKESERYDRLKQILAHHTRSTLDEFKKDKKTIKPRNRNEKTFFEKLFNK